MLCVLYIFHEIKAFHLLSFWLPSELILRQMCICVFISFRIAVATMSIAFIDGHHEAWFII